MTNISVRCTVHLMLLKSSKIGETHVFIINKWSCETTPRNRYREPSLSTIEDITSRTRSTDFAVASQLAPKNYVYDLPTNLDRKTCSWVGACISSRTRPGRGQIPVPTNVRLASRSPCKTFRFLYTRWWRKRRRYRSKWLRPTTSFSAATLDCTKHKNWARNTYFCG